MPSSSVRLVLTQRRSPWRAQYTERPEGSALSVIPVAVRSTRPRSFSRGKILSGVRSRISSVTSVPSMKKRSGVTSASSTTSPDSRNFRPRFSPRPNRRR